MTGHLLYSRVMVKLSQERGYMIIHNMTPVTYEDNYGNEMHGMVVGHDDHHRAIIVIDGAGKFDPMAVVDYDNILTVGLKFQLK